jgi:hypothetical protein
VVELVDCVERDGEDMKLYGEGTVELAGLVVPALPVDADPAEARIALLAGVELSLELLNGLPASPLLNELGPAGDDVGELDGAEAEAGDGYASDEDEEVGVSCPECPAAVDAPVVLGR